MSTTPPDVSSSDTKKLAILGGKPIVPADIGFSVWPVIDESDEKLVLESLRQPAHAFGPHCVKLQKEFAEWNGNKFCAATNSGTAALHMSIAACGIGAGDQVITTTASWTSTATSILHHNAIPVFVDVEWNSMHIDPAKIEAAITPYTRAILPVHYWGVTADMDAILAIAKKHNLYVIEDACQAPGSLYKGRRAGTMGHCAAFSLNQNKNFCGGEGGLFVSNDEELFTKGRALMNFGEMRAPEADRDFHSYGMGWMYRTSDLPASFALAQLRKLTKTNAHARENWLRLDKALEGTPNLVRPFNTQDRPSNGYAYIIRVDPAYVAARGVSDREFADAVGAALRAEGLPVNPARWLLPEHSVFQARNGYGKGSPWSEYPAGDVSYDLAQYPVGRKCVDSTLWVGVNTHRPPNGPRQVDAVAAAIGKVFENLDHIQLESKS